MAELIISNKEDLVAVANAIREKTGKTDAMTVTQMVGEIEGITTGGGGEMILTSETSVKNTLGIIAITSDTLLEFSLSNIDITETNVITTITIL